LLFPQKQLHKSEKNTKEKGIDTVVKKYRYGTPFPTEATVLDLPVTSGSPDFLQVSCEESHIAIRYTMQPNDVLYGLGENVRGINKRGWIFESNATDDNLHLETKHSLYASHNFLIVAGDEVQFGIFLDNPGIVSFDLGYTHYDEIKITVDDPNTDLYVITGESLTEIARQFRQLVGHSYIPPKWAFGFGQSRWGYKCEADVWNVVNRMEQAGIPLDAVYLDIDYMKDYKDFTVDTERFPDLPRLVKELKQRGIHLVPIIDAGVKIEVGYEAYDEGVEKGYFCKTADGENFTGAVWPGKVHFPDVLNPEARKWFGSKYKSLVEQGIEGFWNDMNEPAIFYSVPKLKNTLDMVERYSRMKELGLQEYFGMLDEVRRLQDASNLYDKFYHNVDGQMVCHKDVHNLYGFNMTRAAGEALEALVPNKRTLLFSRSSYVGMHRYGGIWTGDNCSWWSHLQLNIQQMPSLNLIGLLFSGADLGGYSENCTTDLLMRWLAFGIFTPLMRNHCAAGFRAQEPYQFGRTEDFANIIKLRYSLLPYLYSEFMKAALNDGLYFRALAFDYPHMPDAAQVEDQLLVGESIMIAPVYQPNATRRTVFLPEPMELLRFRTVDDYDRLPMEAGYYVVDCNMNEVLVFLRPGHLLPMADPAGNVASLDEQHLKVFANLGEQERASYVLYQDDGYTREYHNPEHYKTIQVDSSGAACSDAGISLILKE
jgi:alpha-glucosidase